jgi:hypothetical protein
VIKPENILSVDQLYELREAFMHSYEAGRFPEDIPE